MRFFSKKLLLVTAFVGIFFIGFLFSTRFFGVDTLNNNTSENNSGGVLQKFISTPTPTPFFLQEITLPALRARDYQSSLGELIRYSSSNNYTSYLTNYDSDGLKINGLLTIPISTDPNEKFPAIVFVHGYIAPTIYETTQRYNDYVNYLARNGLVVFKIDLRGHGESEGDAGGAYYSGDYVIDVLNAYSALQDAEFVDPRAVGLWGHSMAGNVTFRAFVAKRDVPALVIWAGAGYTYTDLSEYRLNDQSYRPPGTNTERAKKRQAMREAYGEFDPNHWFWKQVPATNYLEGVGGAIQLHHAVNDSVVNVEYSSNLMDVLDGSGIAHEFYKYETGGHNLESPTFSVAMSRTVDFFHKYLK